MSQAAIDRQLLAGDEDLRVRAQKGHGIGQGVAIERLRNALHALDHGLVILGQATGLQAVHHQPRQHGIDRDAVRFRLFLCKGNFHMTLILDRSFLTMPVQSNFQPALLPHLVCPFFARPQWLAAGLHAALPCPVPICKWIVH